MGRLFWHWGKLWRSVHALQTVCFSSTGVCSKGPTALRTQQLQSFSEAVPIFRAHLKSEGASRKPGVGS